MVVLPAVLFAEVSFPVTVPIYFCAGGFWLLFALAPFGGGTPKSGGKEEGGRSGVVQIHGRREREGND